MRWFRLYDEVLDDPKVQFLPPEQFKAWVNLLCLASKNEGKLPDMQAISFALRLPFHETQTIVENLVSLSLLDRGKNGLIPHNWSKRQYKSDTSTDRVKRFRNVARNVSKPLHETVPDTDNRNRTNTTSVSNSLIYNRQQGLNGVNGVKNGEGGEVEPRHNARSRTGFIYCRKGTFEFTQYAADYRAKWQDEPQTNKWGGRWFSLLGEK